jgi:hypothetical protein
MLKVAVFVLLSAIAGAGSITVSISDNPIFAVTPQNGAGQAGSACLTPFLGSQNCVTGLQPSDSFGGAQSSASSQPLPLTAEGQLTGAFPGAESSTATYGNQAANYNSLFVFPSVSVSFAPAGATGSADVNVSQNANDFLAENADVALILGLTGISSASFNLDAVAGTMNLSASSGVSGDIVLSYRGAFCTDCGPGGTVSYSGDLIDFVFLNGVVITSSNTLGLALPAVGSAANFALSSLSPFEYTFPDNFANGFCCGFNGNMTNIAIQDANLVAPEPGGFLLTFAGLGALLVWRARSSDRRNRLSHQDACYTRTDAALPGSRLPSGSRA